MHLASIWVHSLGNDASHTCVCMPRETIMPNTSNGKAPTARAAFTRTAVHMEFNAPLNAPRLMRERVYHLQDQV